jgi:formyltetrahydrofolate synthetase
MSDIEIARAANKKAIQEVGAKIGILLQLTPICVVHLQVTASLFVKYV